VGDMIAIGKANGGRRKKRKKIKKVKSQVLIRIRSLKNRTTFAL
jgi:hypothetical protein